MLLIVKDKEYNLKPTTKSLIAMEQRLGYNPLNAFVRAGNGELPKLSDVLIILHGCLTPFNHSIKLDDVYKIYDDYVDDGNNLLGLIEILIECFKDVGFIPDDEKN